MTRRCSALAAVFISMLPGCRRDEHNLVAGLYGSAVVSSGDATQLDAFARFSGLTGFAKPDARLSVLVEGADGGDGYPIPFKVVLLDGPSGVDAIQEQSEGQLTLGVVVTLDCRDGCSEGILLEIGSDVSEPTSVMWTVEARCDGLERGGLHGGNDYPAVELEVAEETVE